MAPKYPVEAFAGTSPYYLRFRPTYPSELLKDLLERAQVHSSDQLLDLACGPGRITLALSQSFKSVCAVDLEPEMIAEAKQEASRVGVSNITWHVGRAEEFEGPREPFKLVTIGDAFHRLDQERILQLVMAWLEPRGGLAIVGSGYLLSGDLPWQRALADVQERWTGQKASVAARASEEDIRSVEIMLRRFQFTDVSSFSFSVSHTWTADSIVGYLYSTSNCSKRILGDNARPFEDEVRQVLRRCSENGTFSDTLVFGYTFGHNH